MSHWVANLNDLYELKVGTRLYPGSLNVRLHEPLVLPEPPMRLNPEESGEEVTVDIYPCRFNQRQEAFVLRPHRRQPGVAERAEETLEVAASVRLRDEFQLRDGDLVTIELERR